MRNRIGTRTPSDLGDLIEQRLPFEDTGMVYDVHHNVDDFDDRLIVGAWHESVGQVTWYYVDPTEPEWSGLLVSTFPIVPAPIGALTHYKG